MDSQQANRVYNKLTNKYSQEHTYYDSPYFVGQVDADGQVGFQRKLTNGELSYTSPQEEIAGARELLASLPPTMAPQQRERYVNQINQEINFYESQPSPPASELRRLNKGFQEYTQSPAGRRVFWNEPVGGMDGTRAKIYRRQGFVDAGVEQYYDNRRFANFPQIDELYRTKDEAVHGTEVADALQKSRQQRIAATKAATQRLGRGGA